MGARAKWDAPRVWLCAKTSAMATRNVSTLVGRSSINVAMCVTKIMHVAKTAARAIRAC